ncbi:MAG: NAD(P)H-binding protein [Deltaproteobacteria bacterium]|nr:NAD(P)H-binding protein [Deltaproteobacteria bacterium]
MTDSHAFVAGATGYTGQAVVEVLRGRGVKTTAHVRPDSSRREQWTERWEALGADVDTTAWDVDALTRTFAAKSPTLVFALLGTTRSRAQDEGRDAVEGYETIDFGLTMMLRRAAQACATNPRFVYLSAAGLREDTRNPYMAVRARVEAALREGTLPYTIARPSFITGPNREQSRPLERLGASVADTALSFAGMLGGRRLRDRYQSMDNTTLARGLVDVALDPDGAGRIVEGEELRSRAGTA